VITDRERKRAGVAHVARDAGKRVSSIRIPTVKVLVEAARTCPVVVIAVPEFCVPALRESIRTERGECPRRAIQTGDGGRAAEGLPAERLSRPRGA
jgi:ferredoxin